MRKFQKFSVLLLVAFVGFGLGCTKKASQDEVNQLKDQIALLDSLANVGKDGFIRGTFTGATTATTENPSTPVTYTFNYQYDGFGSDYSENYDEDDAPEYVQTYRTELNNGNSNNYFGLGIELDLPGSTAVTDVDYIDFSFRTKLPNGQTFTFGRYYCCGDAEENMTFSNVVYSNNRLTGNFTLNIPEQSGGVLSRSPAATVTGSFDIPASSIVRRGSNAKKGSRTNK